MPPSSPPARLDMRVHAIKNDFLAIAQGQHFLEGSVILAKCDVAYRDHVACDLDPKFLEEQLGERAGGDASGCLTRAGPLEHVPGLAEVELQASGQVGVAGPGR